MRIADEPKRGLRDLCRQWIAVSVCVLFGSSFAAQAFEQLNAAQRLVYDTAHLSNTMAGQQISYRYHGRIGDEPLLRDQVSLLIEAAHSDDRRDLELEFLTAERRLPLPDFDGFRGNPVIIAMLEHIAQQFGAETGGGILYFRNRIRDALADSDTRIEQIELDRGSQTIPARRILFSPFAKDPYLSAKPAYAGALFTITVSAEVPGGVVGVAVKSGRGGQQYFEREITLE